MAPTCERSRMGEMGASISGDTLKWLVYHGKLPLKWMTMGDVTSIVSIVLNIFTWNIIWGFPEMGVPPN